MIHYSRAKYKCFRFANAKSKVSALCNTRSDLLLQKGRNMRIAIMGFGTVGSGAYEIAKAADDIEIVRILARHGREGYEHLDEIITPNIDDITGDDSIELVIESMGGIEPAREYVLACLRAGKHVVTPNKNLISACYDELMTVAEENGVELRFTATAGGGIPWLYNLSRTCRCDTIKEVRGIVNGTCNYILDAMHEDGVEYADILKKAQELGYAEANPAADVEGTDTQRKTVISANIAFNTIIREEDVHCFGISNIEATDIEWFKDHGYTCKLIMTAKNAPIKNGMMSAYVEPTLFPSGSLEANVKSNNNLITLVGESIGTQSFYGQGAGALPTGESVIQDVIDIRDGVVLARSIQKGTGYTVDNDSEIHKYYLRYEKGQGVTAPMSVAKMHELARKYEETGKKIFFAAIKE